MKVALGIATTCVCAALTTTALMASTSVGVFAIVDEVALEPTDSAPERIRIVGVFVVPVPMSSGLHQPPARGYLYFSMNPAMAEAIRKDWADLKAAAGTGQVVGFGQYWVQTPHTTYSTSGTMNRSLEVHVHNEGESASPEPYPVPKGIVKTFDTEADTNPRFGEMSSVIIARLRQAYRR
jgi:hypothetical protein